LLWAVLAGCLLSVPPVVASEASGGGFELVSAISPVERTELSSGGEFELKGEVRQPPLRIYGGEYSLGVTAGFDAVLVEPCACLCWGMGVLFIDGFESGDTGEWSLTVP
jgi:hypothetical protein